MAKTDETHELIRAMSANEKRFFRLSSVQAGKETNYLRVFSALDGAAEYDPEKITRKLRGKRINLSYEKTYLHKQLLRSLRHFYSDSNSSIELQDILKSLEILYRKRLNAQCQKLISRGITVCKQFEQWNYHLELIDWQYRLYARVGNYKAFGEYGTVGFREKKELTLRIMEYSSRLEEAIFVMSVLQQKSMYLDEAERKRFEQLRLRFSRKSSQEIGSFRATDLLYAAQYLLHHYLGDMNQAYLWSSATQELYRKHPQFISDQPFRYFASKSAIISRCLNLRKHEEVLKHIDDLKDFTGKLSAFNLQEIREEYLLALLGWQTRVYFKMRQNEEALRIAKEFEQHNKPKRLRQNLRLFADSDLSRIYFSNNLYKESLRFVNRQIRDGIGILKLDYLLFAYLLRLCIYVELKNHDLLDSQVGAVKRFMKKNKIQDEFALHLVELVKSLGAARDGKTQKQFFGQSYNTLKKFLTPEMEQYEVILEWMKGKSR